MTEVDHWVAECAECEWRAEDPHKVCVDQRARQHVYLKGHEVDVKGVPWCVE